MHQITVIPPPKYPHSAYPTIRVHLTPQGYITLERRMSKHLHTSALWEVQDSIKLFEPSDYEGTIFADLTSEAFAGVETLQSELRGLLQMNIPHGIAYAFTIYVLRMSERVYVPRYLAKIKAKGFKDKILTLFGARRDTFLMTHEQVADLSNISEHTWVSIFKSSAEAFHKHPKDKGFTGYCSEVVGEEDVSGAQL